MNDDTADLYREAADAGDDDDIRIKPGAVLALLRGLERIEVLEAQLEKSAHMLAMVVGRMQITDPQWGARIDIMMLHQKGEITAERAVELVSELEGGPWQ